MTWKRQLNADAMQLGPQGVSDDAKLGHHRTAVAEESQQGLMEIDRVSLGP